MSLPARTSLPAVGALVLGLLLLGPAGAAGAANGQVCMGVVIDDGSAPTAQSAQVAPGTSDLQSMAAAGDTATQNNSGLVCAINNYPSDGLQNCLSTTGNGQYFYWSYWHGDPCTNTWTYANDGPASHTVSAGQTYVEGWRYQNPGPDNPTAPKPSVSPAAAFAQACPGVTPVPAGSTGSSGGGSGSAGGGSAGPGVGSAPATVGSPAAPATPGVTGTGAAPGTPAGGAKGSGNGTTTTTHPGQGVADPAAQGTSTTTTAGTGEKPHGAKTETALAASRGHGGAGAGDPTLPIVIVAILILALGGLAWWRWRRRPLEE